MALTVLVCYDISRDASRARVAAYLQQWGDRIQRSVYVCAVAPEDLNEMISRVEQMIDPTTDAVHLLPTCAACWSRLVVRGQADAAPDALYWAAL
ncbi:MAG: CRISPR-associated endonuclease Cas2 [Actinomycetota bacterium]|nr:CRISPR-associated endonuclease Cas2 [Actinomycetota bacterium]